MTHSRSISLSLLLVVMGACGTSGSKNNGDDGSGPPYSGGSGSDGSGGNGQNGSDDTDPSANVEPTYPTQHPRIYLAANQARLKASLTANTPAAARFKQTVDSWVNGADVYNFSAWNS